MYIYTHRHIHTHTNIYIYVCMHLDEAIAANILMKEKTRFNAETTPPQHAIKQLHAQNSKHQQDQTQPVCCSVLLQCVVACCNVFSAILHTRKIKPSLRVAVCCSVLQCVAVCCSVLQCVVAVCCSVFQCV